MTSYYEDNWADVSGVNAARAGDEDEQKNLHWEFWTDVDLQPVTREGLIDLAVELNLIKPEHAQRYLESGISLNEKDEIARNCWRVICERRALAGFRVRRPTDDESTYRPEEPLWEKAESEDDVVASQPLW